MLSTEDKLVDIIANGLRGVVAKDALLLSLTLTDAFGISVSSCPELVMAVQDKLSEAKLEE
jgi:hypothetical protein